MKPNTTVAAFSVGRDGYFWHVGTTGVLLYSRANGKAVQKRAVGFPRNARAVFAGMTPDEVLFVVCFYPVGQSKSNAFIMAIDHRTSAVDRYDFECPEIPFFCMRLSTNGNFVYLGSMERIVRVFISRDNPGKSRASLIDLPNTGRILGLCELAAGKNIFTDVFFVGELEWGHCVIMPSGAVWSSTDDWPEDTPRSDLVALEAHGCYAAISAARQVCIYSNQTLPEPVAQGYCIPDGAEVLSFSSAPRSLMLTFRLNGRIHFRRWQVDGLRLIQRYEADAADAPDIVAAAPSWDCRFGMYATESEMRIIRFNKD